MLEIRPAREADQLAIVQLWHQGWHDAHAHLVPTEILAFRTPEHFLLWLKQSTDAFHVAVDDELLGFVSINGAELVKLYVSPQARGSRTAHDLLSHAERLLAEQGVAQAELFCTAGNVRAEVLCPRRVALEPNLRRRTLAARQCRWQICRGNPLLPKASVHRH
jgi:ribosomal protein S18 acetylase RimI-like enzyme